jgi:hypothetical protein
MIQFQCTCGQALTAADQDAGLEMRCPVCNAAVRVPGAPGGAPGSGAPTDAGQSLNYVAPATGDPMVTPRAVEMVRQTTLWVRIMGVLMFVGCGFMVLAGVAMMVIGLAANGGRGDPPAFLGCIYIPLAALYIMPAVFLWRYANHCKSFAAYRHEQELEEALQAQKSFWKFVAITALVVIGLYILIIPIAIVAALMAH